MADIARLPELAERLEKATGPDRELDTALFVAFHSEWRLASNSFGPVVEYKGIFHRIDEVVLHYTASIDAALSLVERLGFLPDEMAWGAGFVSFKVWPRSGGQAYCGQAPTAPLAILRAMVAALIAGDA